ncbi:hypothetical protein [Paraclostridium sordellii]|uniref:hypothetical protein n=1 Tax=Paraclostridium sordellii TaxID=1505 RepID=UPI001FA98A5F|nr:hypothetical protein [Paeniclostridium sordellii]
MLPLLSLKVKSKDRFSYSPVLTVLFSRISILSLANGILGIPTIAKSKSRKECLLLNKI